MDSLLPAAIDESARKHFEAGWLIGCPEPIEKHLPAADDPRYLGTVEELVHIDLEFAWKNPPPGGPSRVESYLARFPKLDQPGILIRLVQQEYRARRRAGERPTEEEYRQRFPALVTSARPEFEPTLLAPASSNPSVEPPRIPGYQILATLGKGGMGIVFRAYQTGLNRMVALKMILSDSIAGSGDRERFRTEAEATATLKHPHIVRVHEVGEVGGRPFFSMDFIGGPNLATRLEQGPLPASLAARHAATIARAIQHAHEHGILHRDLKPANILLDEEGEPHVTDFGLAKRLDSGPGLTQTGAILGTPSYMAPEQACGAKEVTVAVDIYGLGATLYELLTGRPPFRAATTLETLRQVLEIEPAPPRVLNPSIDRDLETICLKCLEKQPERRYRSAAALADDLEKYLAGDPITARSLNLLDRLARTLGRSSSESEFHNWGSFLFLSGAIVLVCHIASFFANLSGLPFWTRLAIGGTQFVLIAIAFCRYLPGKLLPSTPNERQLWAIWIGYLLAFWATLLINLSLADPTILAKLLAGQGDGRSWQIYPYSTMLSGMAFFVMGSSYWGGFFLIGFGFLAAAVLMPMFPESSPLAFGLMWSGTLILIGLRVRKHGVEKPSVVEDRVDPTVRQ